MGFAESQDHGDGFGAAAAALGDLDGDGIGDVAIGAENDDDSGIDSGAVWILFPTPGDNARAVFRTDSMGLNNLGYTAEVPLLGTTWHATVDNTTTSNLIAIVVGYAGSTEIHVPRWNQFVLVDPTSPGGELLGLDVRFGVGVMGFSATIPLDLSLVGAKISTQGAGAGGVNLVTLHNAYDLVLGAF